MIVLYQMMLRIHAKKIFGFAIGSFAYLSLIMYIFPTLPKESLNELMQKMPPEVLKVFGLDQGFSDLLQFISGEYYGFLFLVFLMVFVVLTSAQLIAALIDRGSMVYLLTTGVSRRKIALVQALVLFSGIVIIALFTTFAGLLGNQVILDTPSLAIKQFLQINLIGCSLFFAIGSINFFFSCLFSDEKRAIGYSAAFTIVFFALDFAGKLNEDLEWIRNFTPFSLFEPVKVSLGEVNVLFVLGIYAGISLLFLLLGVVVFRRKDLSI